MIITRFRSVWGIDSGDNLNNWANWFPDLKKQGYTGVEVDIHGLQNPDRDFKRLREICDQVDLEISAMVHSSWFQYLGPRPVGLTAENHLQNYRELLQLIEPLKPVNINFQSGSTCQQFMIQLFKPLMYPTRDAWDVEESIKFYRGTLKIDQALGVAGRVVHETHRNRSLFTPYATRKILEAVPQLRITADFSHWMVGLERLLDIGEGDRAMMDAIIPHVHHIHARIGTTQASQCPEPLNPVFKEERLCMERLWTRVLQTRFEQSDSDTEIRFVPEYGPFPYHPIGSIKTHSQVADEEGQRLQTYFTEFAASLKA